MLLHSALELMAVALQLGNSFIHSAQQSTTAVVLVVLCVFIQHCPASIVASRRMMGLYGTV